MSTVAQHACIEVACPTCGMPRGFKCVNARANDTAKRKIHEARIDAYLQEIGTEEFRRRHGKIPKQVIPAVKAKPVQEYSWDLRSAYTMARTHLENLTREILNGCTEGGGQNAYNLAIKTEEILEQTDALTSPYIKP